MRPLFRLILISLTLTFAQSAVAEREVHVVAVGKGQPSPETFASPEAHVLVDRPGQEVGLVLLDGGDLTWRVEASEDTFITEIIRSGPSPRDSAVFLSGIPVDGVQVTGLPLVFNPWGQDFRKLLAELADSMGTTRIQSFQGVHKSPADALRVDFVDTGTRGLARDYLAEYLDRSDDLPAALQSWLEDGQSPSDYAVTFASSGITLVGPEGTQQFPVSADVPAILLPVMAVYVPETQMIYGVTYGAEGFVYAVDAGTGAWELVTSLNGYDAATLLYDAPSRALIMTGAFARPGDIQIVGLDGQRASTFLPVTAFPGLSDLFDFGNDNAPPLIPLVFADSWLLLRAQSASAGVSRLYAVQLETNDVRLLRYQND